MNGFHGAARPLTQEYVGEVANRLGTDEAALRAVLSVETNGSGFDYSGRPKALFERHIFYRQLEFVPAKLKLAMDAGLAYKKWGERPYPKTSNLIYAEIEAAYEIDPSAALKSTSWGLGQIMGFNYINAGCGSVEEMVQEAMDSEDMQLDQFASFIRVSGLDLFLRNKDWAAFASRYNGPGYAQNQYDVKLADAYEKWTVEA